MEEQQQPWSSFEADPWMDSSLLVENFIMKCRPFNLKISNKFTHIFITLYNSNVEIWNIYIFITLLINHSLKTHCKFQWILSCSNTLKILKFGTKILKFGTFSIQIFPSFFNSNQSLYLIDSSIHIWLYESRIWFHLGFWLGW